MDNEIGGNKMKKGKKYTANKIVRNMVVNPTKGVVKNIVGNKKSNKGGC